MLIKKDGLCHPFLVVSGGAKLSKKRRKKRRSSPIRTLVFLLTLILLLIGVFAGMVYTKLGSTQTSPLDQSQLVTVNNDSSMKDYTNYAFFGIDSQTGSMSDRGNRSDSIIIVSINNSTKEVKLLSVYRDTFVSINGRYNKINAAYSWGGPELAVSTINRNLDLNIEKYATVNFKILADLVDAIGGIEVDVDSSILKNLNAYIKDMNRINGGNSPTLPSGGTYTLDGNQAVAYSRIRYTAGGDLARAGRQREVLQKIFEKGKKSPLKLMSALDKVLPQVKTNMDQKELFNMFLSAFRYEIKDQQGFPWDQKEMKYYGTYYGFPTTLKENAIRAHKYLFGTDNYQISDELGRINQKIIWRVGY
ncbi:cell envelope-like function transcriptional attenuator common domain protein [Anaerostipes sp. 494a]|nr:cell envelope-like function transcriptional attenuator common domain protein [Anaerostipes sp. 494a]